MREILFRGKTLENSKWVYGSLVALLVDGKKTCCITSVAEVDVDNTVKDDLCFTFGRDVHIVVQETIGQETGIRDSNGKSIYEGDIVRAVNPDGDVRGIGDVEYLDEYGMWYCGGTLNDGLFDLKKGLECEFQVIGNVYDNPELMLTLRGRPLF